MHMNENAFRGQKKISDPVALELQAGLHCPMWVVRIELRFSMEQYTILSIKTSLQPLNQVFEFQNSLESNSVGAQEVLE